MNVYSVCYVVMNGVDVFLFDVFQYVFFGNDVVEEVELGGFEDDDENILAVVINDEY